MVTDSPSPYFTVAESAEYARVHEKTIRYWTKHGLRSFKPVKARQGRLLIKRSDLQDFIERQGD